MVLRLGRRIISVQIRVAPFFFLFYHKYEKREKNNIKTDKTDTLDTFSQLIVHNSTNQKPTPNIINKKLKKASKASIVNYMKEGGKSTYSLNDFDNEFENLARKCTRICKELLERKSFSNEGDIDYRMKKYEDRSNPLMTFINSDCEEDFEKYMPLKRFIRLLNAYLKENRLRPLQPKIIKKKLEEEGFDVRRSTKIGVVDVYIFGLIEKNTENTENTLFEKSILHGNQVEKNGINGINGIKIQELKKNVLYFMSESKKDTLSEEEIPESNHIILQDLKKEGFIDEVKPNQYQLI